LLINRNDKRLIEDSGTGSSSPGDATGPLQSDDRFDVDLPGFGRFRGAKEIVRKVVVTCKGVGGSEQRREFISETAIHFPKLKSLAKPIEWVLLVCLNCGSAEFPETELRVLGDAARRDESELGGERGLPSDMSETRP
jgi:hypothetical protein